MQKAIFYHKSISSNTFLSTIIYHEFLLLLMFESVFHFQSELRICVLPTHLSYDAPWPVRKVPLRCTPHFIAYHLESKTYTVVTSVTEPTTKVV
jgi:hypothetical protein